MDKVSFTLAGIKTTEFCIFELKKNVEGEQALINYNITPAIAIAIENKRINVTIAIIGSIISSNEEYFKGKTVFSFNVIELDKITKVNEDKKISFKNPSIEEDLLKSLISISYSTMRGILIVKGSGTLLQRDFLPLVDPKVFFANRLNK